MRFDRCQACHARACAVTITRNYARDSDKPNDGGKRGSFSRFVTYGFTFRNILDVMKELTYAADEAIKIK